MRQILTFQKPVFAIAFLLVGACRAPERKPELPVVRMATILGRITNPLSASIPAGMYGNQSEIETVGGDMLLACRADLPDELVYWVTRTLFELLPELAALLPPFSLGRDFDFCSQVLPVQES